jgi:hypothetical protein
MTSSVLDGSGRTYRYIEAVPTQHTFRLMGQKSRSTPNIHTSAGTLTLDPKSTRVYVPKPVSTVKQRQQQPQYEAVAPVHVTNDRNNVENWLETQYVTNATTTASVRRTAGGSRDSYVITPSSTSQGYGTLPSTSSTRRTDTSYRHQHEVQGQGQRQHLSGEDMTYDGPSTSASLRARSVAVNYQQPTLQQGEANVSVTRGDTRHPRDSYSSRDTRDSYGSRDSYGPRDNGYGSRDRYSGRNMLDGAVYQHRETRGVHERDGANLMSPPAPLVLPPDTPSPSPYSPSSSGGGDGRFAYTDAFSVPDDEVLHIRWSPRQARKVMAQDSAYYRDVNTDWRYDTMDRGHNNGADSRGQQYRSGGTLVWPAANQETRSVRSLPLQSQRMLSASRSTLASRRSKAPSALTVGGRTLGVSGLMWIIS